MPRHKVAPRGMRYPGTMPENEGFPTTPPRRFHRTEDFEAMYAAAPPPWDIGRPQRPFLSLLEEGAIRGRVLDVGCGTGEHVLMCAAHGLDATGIDSAATAIAAAQAKAKERGLPAHFLLGNALHLSRLGAQFDTVLDSGLFHVFDDADRQAFVDSLRAVTAPGSRYIMMCFSDRQPGDFGPRRVTQAEIRSSFAEGWRVDSIEPSRFDIRYDTAFAEAWLARMTRE
jgi:SAM-dependent methyltransferase